MERFLGQNTNVPCACCAVPVVIAFCILTILCCFVAIPLCFIQVRPCIVLIAFCFIPFCFIPFQSIPFCKIPLCFIPFWFIPFCLVPFCLIPLGHKTLNTSHIQTHVERPNFENSQHAPKTNYRLTAHFSSKVNISPTTS